MKMHFYARRRPQLYATLFVCILALVMSVLMTALTSFLELTPGERTLLQLLRELLCCALPLGVAFLLNRGMQFMLPMHRMSIGQKGAFYPMAFLMIFPMALLQGSVRQVLHRLNPSFEMTVSGQEILLWPMLLICVLRGTFTEELLFHGYLESALSGKLKVPAPVCTGILFALATCSVYGFIPALFLCIILTAILRRTDSLPGIMAIHAIVTYLILLLRKLSWWDWLTGDSFPAVFLCVAGTGAAALLFTRGYASEPSTDSFRLAWPFVFSRREWFRLGVCGFFVLAALIVSGVMN